MKTRKDQIPVVVEQEFHVSPKRLWSAITDFDELPLWYFENIRDFKAEVGFETQFEVRSEERLFTHLWKVVDVVEGKSISYEWRYKEYPGTALVVFEVARTDEGSLLRVSSLGLESFPQNIPEFKHSSCEAGWNYFIGQRLAAYLK